MLSGNAGPASAYTLDTLPTEILEQIAYFVGTESFLGPPSSLAKLSSANRAIHSSLSVATNIHLYACIFRFKFDTGHVVRRLGAKNVTAAALSSELVQRCVHLKRIRARTDSRAVHAPFHRHKTTLKETLWTAYLMMLENEGNNEQQLIEYARLEDWLKEYWTDERGASNVHAFLLGGLWPLESDENALAMWLFWFLIQSGDLSRRSPKYMSDIRKAIKVIAFGANRYAISNPPWSEFFTTRQTQRLTAITHFAETRLFIDPAIATPAILIYLTEARPVPLPPSLPLSGKPAEVPLSSHEWETEWERCADVQRDRSLYGPGLITRAYKLGSAEGVWEGIFTYSDFSAYAAVLSGAPPYVLQRCVIAQQKQMWRLREYHLVDPSTAYDPIVSPFPEGDPLRSHLPKGFQMSMDAHEGIEVCDPTRSEVLRYRRASACDAAASEAKGEDYMSRVSDVLIVGEGHSAWGEFHLIGRVRPCDGLVSLSKEYLDGERGSWLYRGYLVGNANGRLVGRWRETASPVDYPGYEGCFVMRRRH